MNEEGITGRLWKEVAPQYSAVARLCPAHVRPQPRSHSPLGHGPGGDEACIETIYPELLNIPFRIEHGNCGDSGGAEREAENVRE